ncbi:hypothetical protein K438DRAFT_1988495 [Mycena galopus ATCC 62051]|nr:hypothetical protein K438DRAFT_1988495 [Mycena galopus ATCC 62051]
MATVPNTANAPYFNGKYLTEFLTYTLVYSPITSGLLPANSQSTPVYLRPNPGRHPDHDRMTSSYHSFIFVLFRLNVPVFSGTLWLLSDFLRPMTSFHATVYPP